VLCARHSDHARAKTGTALRATHTLADTAVQLNAEGLSTATGAPWSANTVAKVQTRLLAA